MGWTTTSKKASTGLKNFKMCNLRSVLSSNSESDDSCLSQSLCPLLYNVCSYSSSDNSSTEKDKKLGDPDPPDYYQQVTYIKITFANVYTCTCTCM